VPKIERLAKAAQSSVFFQQKNKMAEVPALGLRARRVASGTFAHVSVGVDALGVLRAVKCARRAGDERMLAREASVLRELRDAPCVVGAMCVATSDARATCVVLDAGRISLARWLCEASKRRGSWRTRGARFAADVALALAHCHARGVVHRDVKPANVVLRNGRAMLVDFGCAARLGARTDMRVGTLAYRAPETALGEATCAAAVDVFALGLLAHEATTATRVSSALVDSEFGQLVRALRVFGDGAPLDWARGLPDYSAALPSPKAGRPRFLGECVVRCCAPDPARRCTAAEAHATLEGAPCARGELGERELADAERAAGAGAPALRAYLARAGHRVDATECAFVARAARRAASGSLSPRSEADRCAERALDAALGGAPGGQSESSSRTASSVASRTNA
jgi:serine/threonine protein kinase